MALSAKTLKVLKAAGLEPADVALFSDEDLLGLPGVGPAVLADIRAMYPAVVTKVEPEATAHVEPVETLMAAAAKVLGGPQRARPAAVDPEPEPATAPAAAPGCTCAQPFRVTRTRQKGNRLERYCDACGAVQGDAPDGGRVGG